MTTTINEMQGQQRQLSSHRGTGLMNLQESSTTCDELPFTTSRQPPQSSIDIRVEHQTNRSHNIGLPHSSRSNSAYHQLVDREQKIQKDHENSIRQIVEQLGEAFEDKTEQADARKEMLNKWKLLKDIVNSKDQKNTNRISILDQQKLLQQERSLLELKKQEEERLDQSIEKYIDTLRWQLKNGLVEDPFSKLMHMTRSSISSDDSIFDEDQRLILTARRENPEKQNADPRETTSGHD